MKDCDILGVKSYSDPFYTYFEGVRTPNPHDLRPWPQEILWRVAKLQNTAPRLCGVECVMLSFNIVCCCCPCCCCFTFRFAEKAGDNTKNNQATAIERTNNAKLTQPKKSP